MQGNCLCGAISVTAPDAEEVALCHCQMCRRWGSGPMHAIHCGAGVNFSGAEPSRYQSSDWAERGFCNNCGTHLFYYLIPAKEYILSAGLFQNHTFSLTTEVFVDEAPGYYPLQDNTSKMTGAEVFALYKQ
ncbi:GFA family protein [Gilvimarinus sp. DA14]|uniref:GFA family protein n=1 Tax=Gilvimarinus sp. DA14 TaxID=2956798 RepID=UPI0020B74860|nr:GFA family protein [Gilvimarinus sp. DA14]UTF59105.1 GFA family protein [Gilvimarinus sp. DA14]